VAGDIDQPAELAASPGSDVVPAAFSDRRAATLLSPMGS